MLPYLEDRVKNNLPETFIFTNPRSGNHYTETTLRRIWAKARTKADFPEHIRLYDATRHSVASQLANQNVSTFQIQNILGHTTVKTTEKYMHKNLDSLRGALSHLSLSDGSKAVYKLESEEKE